MSVPADNKTLQVLEYNRILQLLAEYALSPEAGIQMLEAHFFDNRDTLDEFRTMVESVSSVITSSDYLPSRVQATEAVAEKISKSGNVLEGPEIALAAEFIDAASECLAHFKNNDIPRELSRLLDWNDVKFISREIKTCFTAEGLINPALPEVKKINKQITDLEKKNDELMKKYLHQWSDYLRFANPSSKDGRLVLPVKAEYKARVQGVIHQVSQTGSTLFIEPVEILDNNNALLQAKAEYERIILKYCRKMSELLHLHLADVLRLRNIFIRFDGIYMRARFMNEYNCVYPQTCSSGFVIRQARHLLLNEKPVPLDLRLAKPLSALIISGSNAGGKTVALKTLGLCILMHQAALPVPAADGSEIAMYSFVAADIGDNQSIADSVSTFSGHLARIRDIITSKKKGGLVLLDELGTGTSDEEGAALGVSFLEHLAKAGNTIAATTHNRKIKEYAFSRDDFEIASVNFSEDKHIPVFGLSYGIHGDSHGIDTAVASGMPESIINNAREILKSGYSDLDQALEKIKNMETNLLEKEKELEEARSLLDKQYDEYQKEIDKSVQKRAAWKLELEEMLIDLNSKLEKLKKNDIHISKNDEKSLKADIYKKLDSLEHSNNKNASIDNTDTDIKIALEKGMTVYVKTYDKEGTIIDKAKNNSWLVMIGHLKIAVEEENLTGIKSAAGKTTPILDKGLHVDTATQNLDLRGKTVEEGIEILSRQIDSMLAGGQSWFSLIHGHGPLREGLREYLNSIPQIKSVKYAEQNSGGQGRSIVVIDN